MKNAVLADTTPLFAAANSRDQYHHRAQTQLGQLEARGWAVAVPVSTVMETYTLMLHRLGIRAAHQFLRSLEDAALLLLPTETDVDAAIALVHAYSDQPFTLFDTLLAAMSSRLNVPVWTYDTHFDVLHVDRWYGDAVE